MNDSFQEAFVDRLRKEANTVKDCFTNFSFQAITFGGVGLGLAANFQPNTPFVGSIGLLVIILVLTVSRIGNHKYATANRHFGYELYLERVIRIQKKYNLGDDLSNKLMNAGWEEMMRAWRIVQATVFKEIHYTDRPQKDEVKEVYQNAGQDAWYSPKILVQSSIYEASWHPGDYLHRMQSVLHIMAYFSLIPLLVMTIQFWLREEFSTEFVIAAGIISVVAFGYVFLQVDEIHRRRVLLEEGILSIHSCGIMWHAVVLAHLVALNKTLQDGTDDADPHKGYIQHLAEQAAELSGRVTEIHVWLKEKTDYLKENNLEF